MIQYLTFWNPLLLFFTNWWEFTIWSVSYTFTMTNLLLKSVFYLFYQGTNHCQNLHPSTSFALLEEKVFSTADTVNTLSEIPITIDISTLLTDKCQGFGNLVSKLNTSAAYIVCWHSGITPNSRCILVPFFIWYFTP